VDDTAPLVTVTDAAREKILEVRAGESDPDALALWLEVSGLQGAAYTYDMYFQRLDEAGPDDGVQRHDDLSIVIPHTSLDKTRGSTLDLSDGAGPSRVTEAGITHPK
jgi:Fe-S cluster assembly iron-binding protein IscA